MALELELAVLDLVAVFVGGSDVDVRVSEQQRHLHCLLLRRLSDFADVHCQFSQRPHVVFVDELHVS